MKKSADFVVVCCYPLGNESRIHAFSQTCGVGISPHYENAVAVWEMVKLMVYAIFVTSEVVMENACSILSWEDVERVTAGELYVEKRLVSADELSSGEKERENASF